MVPVHFPKVMTKSRRVISAKFIEEPGEDPWVSHFRPSASLTTVPVISWLSGWEALSSCQWLTFTEKTKVKKRDMGTYVYV